TTEELFAAIVLSEVNAVSADPTPVKLLSSLQEESFSIVISAAHKLAEIKSVASMTAYL
ncbi:MAG: hypothetical protein HON55_02325, partial [Legionellales bacterium]|nr:hypothetical protein [Legionellales bacterium]